MSRPAGCERIFQEDDALRHDPTYPGIHGFWKRLFPNRNFPDDWKSGESTEIDGGDSFTRVIRLNHIIYRYLTVTLSFDGYSVYKSTEKKDHCGAKRIMQRLSEYE